MGWPTETAELESLQHDLAARRAPDWSVPDRPLVAGVFVCFARGRGDGGWAGAAAVRSEALVEASAVSGRASGPYEAGAGQDLIAVGVEDGIGEVGVAVDQARQIGGRVHDGPILTHRILRRCRTHLPQAEGRDLSRPDTRSSRPSGGRGSRPDGLREIEERAGRSCRFERLGLSGEL